MTTSHDTSTEAVLTAVLRLTPAGDDTRLNLLTDPSAAEVVGRWIADEVRQYEPTVVAVWDDPQAAVLAHIVAREVGCVVVRVIETEGLVRLVDAPLAVGRVALLADRFTAENSLGALLGVVENHGLTTVAVAAVVDSEPLDHAVAEGRYPVIAPSRGRAA
ncbi:hypothetical protein AB0893_17630 [Micromonospora aurantiaca]|uniref:hypothetical protein n=1 Tax=Micromonospora aurantiaca (nom. illeg.) TaxID=47850 RepID=UPI0033B83D9B